eukprot:gene15994-21196_t
MTLNLTPPDIAELKPRITVFGVGGAGGNAVNNMITAGLQGVDFVVANTDAQALTMSKAQRIVQMGTVVTQGLGAGSQPDVGAAAAQEVIDEIRDHLSGANMVFDACQVGVVLRAVLFVEVVVGVGAMYGASSPIQWLASLALLTGGALPATLGWLITACSLKTVLQRLSTAQQYVAGVLLGAVAGAYACAMLALVGLSASPPWLASAATG